MTYKAKTSSLLLGFTIISCSSTNESGLRRNKFNLEKIKPNTDEIAYKIIDTSKIYKLISIKVISDEEVVRN